MQLQSMYQEIILDHYRDPHGRGLREPYDGESFQVNPTCGDEVTLRVKLDGDTVADVSYEGLGCSISQASESLLHDLVVGKSLSQAEAIGADFLTLMQCKGDPAVAESRRIHTAEHPTTAPRAGLLRRSVQRHGLLPLAKDWSARSHLVLFHHHVNWHLDLPRFSGEALGQVAARLSNWTGLMKSSAEWRLTGL